MTTEISTGSVGALTIDSEVSAGGAAAVDAPQPIVTTRCVCVRHQRVRTELTTVPPEAASTMASTCLYFGFALCCGTSSKVRKDRNHDRNFVYVCDRLGR